jgi:hypothetical protein
MLELEAMEGEIGRRIYEDVATMSESEAEQLAESNPVAGAGMASTAGVRPARSAMRWLVTGSSTGKKP